MGEDDRKARDRVNSATYRKANPEKIKALALEYYKANSEKIKALRAAYRKANVEKLKARALECYKANSEKLKVKHAQYYVRSRATKNFFQINAAVSALKDAAK